MSRVDEAYRQIHRKILENELPAGFQATEPELAAKLNMSRTPLREALIRLEGEGLVERIPRRGFRVLPMSFADIQEIYQIFGIIEPEMAADIATQGLSKKQLKPLEAAIKGMERAVRKNDVDAWAGYDREFHTSLLALQKNRRLQNYLDRLNSQIHRARMLTVHLRTSHEWATVELRKIMDCILAGDETTARTLFRERWRVVSEELLEILKKLNLAQL